MQSSLEPSGQPARQPDIAAPAADHPPPGGCSTEYCRPPDPLSDDWRERLIRTNHELRQPVMTLALLNHALLRAPDLVTCQDLSIRMGSAIELLRSILDTMADQIPRPGKPSPVAGTNGCRDANNDTDIDTAATVLAGHYIWVIEDHPQVSESIRRLLTSCGAEVALFSRMPPLVQGMRAPHAVLIDQHLPGEATGLELSDSLRRTFPNARLAVLTGDMHVAGCAKSLDSGIPVLQKPVHAKTLIRVLAQDPPISHS